MKQGKERREKKKVGYKKMDSSFEAVVTKIAVNREVLWLTITPEKKKRKWTRQKHVTSRGVFKNYTTQRQ